MRKKLIYTLWILLATSVLTVLVFFIAIWNGWVGYMPDMENLQNPIDRYASQIYSADGKVLGTWNKSRENRIHVEYSNLSPYLVQALVATEDARFYDHSGVDFISLGRAIVKRGLLGQTSAGGGSTITQQLAKQLYSNTASSTFERLMQKPIEWVIAIKLERNFTKEEILTMYLNYFDFLHNAVGIKTAANTYFNKEPKDLSVEEAAVLIGLCKNPSYFNPVRHAERCKERRNVVLSQMKKAGYINQSQCDKLSEKDIVLNFHRTDHKEGSATYLREYLRRYMTAKKPERSDYPSWQYVQYHIDSLAWVSDPLFGWCNKNRKKDGSNYSIYEDGLKIYISMDAKTGAVKAYVGGLDFAHFQYDMAADGRRQVGSTIKPLLYSLAMENGFSPCDKAPNWQQTYMVAGRPWTPRNANHSHVGEMVSLKWGLAQSSNWVSAYLMSRLDPHQFVELLHNYGINNPDIHPSLSLCLGPCDITVMEMVSAYTAFANRGIRCAPMFVSRIEDNEGNVIARFEPQISEVISEESAYKMLVLLQGVIDGGTGGRIRYRYDITAEMGGKTGTTNRNSDAWFMAVTPSLVSGCWVGGEDRDIHFDSMAWGQGATMALPIYAYFIKKVYRDGMLPYRQDEKFDIPADFNPCHKADADDFSAIEDVFE